MDMVFRKPKNQDVFPLHPYSRIAYFLQADHEPVYLIRIRTKDGSLIAPQSGPKGNGKYEVLYLDREQSIDLEGQRALILSLVNPQDSPAVLEPLKVRAELLQNLCYRGAHLSTVFESDDPRSWTQRAIKKEYEELRDRTRAREQAQKA